MYFFLFKKMECPVSLEKMITPRVLPCGHTFDEKSLKKISKCPLCRKKFNVGHVTDLPVNWILTSIDPNIYYKIICDTTNIEEMTIFVKTLEKLTFKIVSAAEKGLSRIVIYDNIITNCPKELKPIIYRMIVKKLRSIGFFVCETMQVSCWGFYGRLCMIISWNHGHI